MLAMLQEKEVLEKVLEKVLEMLLKSRDATNKIEVMVVLAYLQRENCDLDLDTRLGNVFRR